MKKIPVILFMILILGVILGLAYLQGGHSSPPATICGLEKVDPKICGGK